jgi:hypothetical protein
MLTMGALSALAFGSTQEAAAQGGPPEASWRSAEARLVRRLTYGVTQSEVQRAKSLGFTRYLESQLNYGQIDDHICEDAVARLFPALGLSAKQLYSRDMYDLMTQLGCSTLYRAIYSKRQLYQRMVEFWTDHFNIDYTKDNLTWLKVVDDREVIRRYALTTFPQLLKASAHSPAMMVFLDNFNSFPDHPNINYARELMELHTLSVTGGYTGADIREVAKCFTGWTLNGDQGSPNFGKFFYAPWMHAEGSKTVLGQTIGSSGSREGDKVLDLLLAHPSTAHFISFKMARFLLQYDPPEALVQNVAAVYLRTGGDIKAMIRAILTRTNLTAAPAKYKRPFHLAVSAIRALAPTVSSIRETWEWRLYLLGQRPFEWTPPDGYPDKLEFWAGSILPRWNFVFELANNQIGGVRTDLTRLVPSTLRSGTQVVDKINQLLFAGEMGAADKAAILRYLGPSPSGIAKIRGAISMALASPSFQWY